MVILGIKKSMEVQEEVTCNKVGPWFSQCSVPQKILFEVYSTFLLSNDFISN